MTPEADAVFHRNVALVEFDTEEKAQEVLDASDLRGCIVRELTPTAFLVDPNKIAAVAERFHELGYTPNVQGGQ